MRELRLIFAWIWISFSGVSAWAKDCPVEISLRQINAWEQIKYSYSLRAKLTPVPVGAPYLGSAAYTDHINASLPTVRVKSVLTLPDQDIPKDSTFVFAPELIQETFAVCVPSRTEIRYEGGGLCETLQAKSLTLTCYW